MHLPTTEMDAAARVGAEPGWGASLACAGAVLLMTVVPPLLAGSPALLAPLPMPWIALYLVLPGPLAFAIPAAWFLAWTPQLRAGAGTIPRRSVLLLAVLAALSAWWAVEGWSFGVEYQGIAHTRAVLAVTAGVDPRPGLPVRMGVAQAVVLEELPVPHAPVRVDRVVRVSLPG